MTLVILHLHNLQINPSNENYDYNDKEEFYILAGVKLYKMCILLALRINILLIKYIWKLIK